MRIAIDTSAAYLVRLIVGLIVVTRRLASISILFVIAANAFAQSEDNVRFTQGKVSDSAVMSVEVPLGNYEGRGIDLPVSLSYSSALWNIEYLGKVYVGGTGQSVVEAIFAKNSTSGWKSGLDLPVIEFSKQHDVYNFKGQAGGQCNIYRIRKVIIYMPDGSTHELRKDDTPRPEPIDMTGTFYAVDGSRMRFEANGTPDTGTIYMPDGTRYVLGHPTSQIIDRHGNTLTYNESNRQWTDTLGRVIANPLPATPTVGDFQYSLPGLAGVNGGQQTYTFKWRRLADSRTGTPPLRYVADHYLPNPNTAPGPGNMPQQQSSGTTFFQTGYSYNNDNGLNQSTYLPTVVVGRGQTGGYLFDPVVLAEIVLPNGTSYKFSYNEYAELDKLVYPTGAYESYEYETKPMEIAGFDAQGNPVPYNKPYDQAKRKVKARRLSTDGTGTDLLEWKYIETRWPSGPAALGVRTSIIAPDLTRTEIDRWRDPNPEEQTVFGYSDSRVGMVLQRRQFSSSPDGLGGNLLRRELTDYEQSANSFQVTFTCQGTPHTSGIAAGRNPRLVRNVSILFEGTGPALAQTTTFEYDTTHEFTTGIDQIQTAAYHYAVVDNQTAQTGTLSQIPLGTLARSSETSYLNDSVYRDANIVGLARLAKIKDAAGSVVSQSEIVYDEAVYSPAVGRALPTSMKTWDSTRGTDPNHPANQLVTRAKFDGWGNQIETSDANGFVTTTVYDTNYQTFPVQVISPVPDPTGVNGSTTAFTTSTTYDFTAGLPLATTDANGQTTTMEYSDSLLRPTRIVAPNGHQTITEYGLGTTAVTRFVKTRSQIDETKWKEGYSWYDGIGRAIKTQRVDSNGDVFVETQYDNMSRPKKVTNPYRSTEPVYWTESFYDDLGRVTKIKTADNAEVHSTYSLATAGTHVGTAVTVTDQAERARRSITNGLGHLSRVDEPNNAEQLGSIDAPNQPTFYAYDILSNLTQVQQNGVNSEQCGGTTSCSQTRTFVYDSLSRLLSATNLESGTINYQYDPNGNLTRKTDARGVQTDYTYDALNRATNRNYTTPTGTPPNYQATPNVTYFYDNLPNAKGKLVKVTNGTGVDRSTTEYTAFDVMGRVTRSKQTTDGVEYGGGTDPTRWTTYAYNLSGALIEQQYPSGRVVRNTLDADGDLQQVESRRAGDTFRNHANSFTYTAAGAVSAMRLGNGKWESTQFNSRLQPTQIGLGASATSQNLLTLNYDYGTNDNNGNVKSQTITVPTIGAAPGFVATQIYTYDSLNRIKQATETIPAQTGWQQTFVYDRYGNRRFDVPNTTTLAPGCAEAICNPQINTSNNRLVGYSFDSGGNTATDAEGKTFVYDSENKQVEVRNAANQVLGQYFYNGDGQRIKKIVPATGETTVFVYDATARLVAEYSTIVAPASQAKISYLTSDHLGSPRITTDALGRTISRRDFRPFGEEIVRADYGTDSLRRGFTGYETDGETDLEFAHARYYARVLGRYVSVDPRYFQVMMAIDPQRFNLYTYVRNSPLKWVDPDGEAVRLQGDTAWILSNVLLEMVGGEANFNKYFEIKDGQVVLRSGVKLADGNSGVQLLGELVNSTDTHLYFAGTDGSAAAALFEGSFETDRKGKKSETDTGEKRRKKFEGTVKNESGAEGTLIGTKGRAQGSPQPANLPNGDPVFAVIAYNTGTVQTQGEVSTQFPVETAAQQSGVGQAIRPVSLFIHESSENLVFAQQGAGKMDYGTAHTAAIKREAIIRRELKITGGFAGGGKISTNVPK
jgi:RHS repeat-associated protein